MLLRKAFVLAALLAAGCGPPGSARSAEEGGEPLAGPPEQQARDLDAEESKWGAVVRRLGIKVE